ncbi:MAG: Zn-ribbon domain-containing OB-fold protein, partial [Firmicutes bacterium]|nr:Zn-ribbon domain-containing OB-fold protein [Bacillota bacterium]
MTEQEKRILQETLSLPYAWAMGPVNERFFRELKERRIMGTRCPKCRRVLVPARMFCPRCFEDTTEWVQVSDEGVVRTWTLINFSFAGQLRKPPY